MKHKLSNKFTVGGQEIEVRIVDSIDHGKLGTCSVAEGIIKIAKTFNGREQSESSKLNTFCHELTHSILDTMGEHELSANERFVCSFSGFLAEAMKSFSFYENENNETHVLPPQQQSRGKNKIPPSPSQS